MTNALFFIIGVITGVLATIVFQLIAVLNEYDKSYKDSIIRDKAGQDDPVQVPEEILVALSGTTTNKLPGVQ